MSTFARRSGLSSVVANDRLLGQDVCVRQASLYLGAISIFLLLTAIDSSGQGAGLVASYAMSEGAGAVTADGSGSGHTGVLNGATWTASGKYGSGLSFNGVSARVDIANAPSLNTTTGFTVELWYKANTNNGSLAAKPLGSSWFNSWQLEFTGPLSFTSSNGSTVRFDSAPAPSVGVWHHVAATWDGTTKKLYVDGVQVMTAAATIAFDTSRVVLGGDYNGGAFAGPFNGLIDEVRIYNRALTLAEIQVDLATPISGSAPDTIAPSVPGGLAAVSVSTSQIDLSWSTSTDNVAVAGYQVFRNGAQAGASTTLVYSDTGLVPSTTYSYTVRAFDAAGNISAHSATAVATTGAIATFQETTFVSGLSGATAMEFAPDGRLFVCQQGGALRVVKNGVLLPTPFVSLSVAADSERGLLGVAFDPNFATTRWIYLYYTRSQSPIKNRVSRVTASSTTPDVVEPGSEVVLLDDIPSDSGYHNGGGIHFAPDGTLFIGVGDGGQTATNAQSLSSLSGKILRINGNGTIPGDNPFVGTAGARGEIWALGFRNPFTFAIDGPTNRVYINDVGQATWEEVNQGVSGGNFGWPTCEGTCSNPAFQNPLYQYNHDSGSAAVTGGVFYRGSQFPSSYVGDYFFADYLRAFIRRLTPANQAIDFRVAESPVDLKVGPDGSLYYLSLFTGAIKQIRYSTAGNRAPTPVVSAMPASGAAPLTVNFSAAGSSDPDGDSLFYVWAFGDGQTGTGLTTTHVYSGAGTFTAVLTVDDGRGGTAQANTNITIGTPPAITIISPIDTSLYSAGETIAYAGDATGAGGASLPASAFSWTIVFHHQTHTHAFLGPIIGVKSGTFVIPTVGETSAEVWYRIILTVTDSGGIQATRSVDVLPRKATITLSASTPGLQLTLDGQPATAPFSVLSVVGLTRTIGAPSPQSFQGRTYAWSAWSDGAAAIHTIPTPAVDTTYTSTYLDVTDVTPPLVSLTAPAAGATVAGTVTVSATATDNIGVAGVQFKRDGANFGTEVTVPPYTISWNTMTVGNGPHTLSAVARDAAGNATSAPIITVTVANPVNTGLVASYAMAEGTGLVTADGSGNGNTGVLNGATWTAAGKYGSGLSFNGVSSRVDIAFAPSLNTTTGFTVALWYNATTNGGSLAAKPLGTSWFDSWQLEFVPGLTFMSSNGSTVRFDSTAAPSVGVWHHVAATWDGATKKLYLDGVQVMSVAATIAFDTSRVVLGGDYNGSTFAGPFRGLIDEVRIYNRALTLTEIQTDLVTPIGSIPDTTPPSIPGGLVAVPVSATRIDLTWTAATDDRAVVGYQVLRNGVQVATVTTLVYSDTVLAPSTTYSYTVKAFDAAGNTSAPSNTAVATTSVADVTPPLVSLTAPAAGATVAGTVTVSATATDNIGVAGVQFKRDGANFGTEVTVPPYTISWNTMTVGNGPHTLSAVARDAAGNATSAPIITVTVANPVNTGLVASYAMAEGTGLVTADGSGNGNTGVLNGATWTAAGKYGSGLSFNGVSSRVDIAFAPSLNTTTGFTVALWYNATTNGGSLAAKPLGTSWFDSWQLEFVPGLTFMSSNGSTVRFDSTAAPSVGVWHHVAATWDGATKKLYLDGVQVMSVAATIAFDTSRVVLGGDYNGSTFAGPFRGLIDEVRIYNRALTLAEIQTDLVTPLTP